MNLNVFGALSGAFSSKSSKKTEDDGSTVEHREEELRAKGTPSSVFELNLANGDQALVLVILMRRRRPAQRRRVDRCGNKRYRRASRDVPVSQRSKRFLAMAVRAQ